MGADQRSMIEPIDIYRTARVLIIRYGEAAESDAARRMDDFNEQGNAAAATFWRQIRAAIRELQGKDNADN